MSEMLENVKAPLAVLKAPTMSSPVGISKKMLIYAKKGSIPSRAHRRERERLRVTFPAIGLDWLPASGTREGQGASRPSGRSGLV